MVSARKPLQQTQNKTENKTRYQNSFSNTTSPKFVDFGEASFENCNFTFNGQFACLTCKSSIITLRNDRNWLANCWLPDEFLLLVGFYIMVKFMNRNRLTKMFNVVFFLLS